jgi:nucleotide-binding universal stress UspA family protein
MGEDGKGGRIVVGVDDSPGGRAALAYALREGKLRGARVEVLGAFARPEFWAGQAIPGWSMGPSMEEIREGVKAHVDRVVAEVREEVGDDALGVTVLAHAVAGNAAAALLDSARHADLLVVGSRGRGGFSAMRLGSVSLQCVLHAPCPVTVVPAAPVGASHQVPAQASAAG